MNVKSSPSSPSGPSRRGRGSKRARVRSTSSTSVASKQPVESTRPGGGVRGFGKRNRTSAQTDVGPTFTSRLRSFLPVAALPNGIVVMVAIVFALIALIATSSSMAALPSTIAQFWLVVNMVPVQGAGHTIGYLPMLPAALLALVVAKRVHALVKEKVSLADLGVLLLCVLLIPILLTLTAAAMLYDASVVYPVGVPNIAVAMGMTALLHGSAFVIGMGRRLWRAILRRFSMPTWLVESALLGARGIAVLGAVSLAAVIISLGIHYRAVADSLNAYDSGAGVLGVVTLSVLYLPNAIVAAIAMFAGSEFNFGEGLYSLFGVNSVPLPPVPLLGALPASAHPWAAILLVVTGICMVNAVYRNVPRLGTGLAAAIFAGVYALVLSIFGSGSLGVYGNVGPHIWMTAGFILAWCAVVNTLAVAVVALVSRRVASADADDSDYVDDGLSTDKDVAEHTDELPPAADNQGDETEEDEPGAGDEEVDETHDPTAVAEETASSEVESGLDDSDNAPQSGDAAEESVPEEAEEDVHVNEEPTPENPPVEEEAESAEDGEATANTEHVLRATPATEPDSTEETVAVQSHGRAWHADAFDDADPEAVVGERESLSSVADQVQQEALEEYHGGEVEQEPVADKSASAKRKRRRGGIFRRK